MTAGPASSPVHDFDGPMLDALVETLFLAAHADGEFSDEERAQFAESVAALTERKLRGEALDEKLASLTPPTEAERPQRLAAIKDRLPTTAARRTAFTLAVKLVAADGIIRTTERELLLDVAEALEMDRDVAADLVKKIARE